MQIPDGYKLIIVAPNGVRVDEIEIGGYDLEKQMARASIMDEIHEITDRDILTNGEG